MSCRVLTALAVTGATVALISTAQAADTVRYVSIDGSNANNCKQAAPCRTLQRGINTTPVGGELRILTSGDYGSPANITKSMTVTGNGHTIHLGAAITINDASVRVILRQLVVNGKQIAKGLSIN